MSSTYPPEPYWSQCDIIPYDQKGYDMAEVIGDIGDFVP